MAVFDNDYEYDNNNHNNYDTIQINEDKLPTAQSDAR